MRFRDRAEAGRMLARELEPYRGRATSVCALPRGGVVLGVTIARHLQCPLELLVVRKIGHPEQPEYAVAAVAEDGCRVGNDAEIAALPPGWFERAIEEQRLEARRRRLLYAAGPLPPRLDGRTAILVDDGLATGLTMECAIKEIRHRGPRTLVVAVPVGADEVVRRLSRQVDALVSLLVPQRFLGAVGSYFDDFTQLTDEDVRALLQPAPGAPPRG